jgi:predicted MFS family arabinose efflux permease
VVAAVVTVSVAGERLRARALAVLLSGLTISTVLGIPLFLVAAPLNNRVFQLAGAAPTLASAANTAFNVGNTLGPIAGGIAITAGYGYTAPSWIAVVLVASSIALAVASSLRDRTDRPRDSARDRGPA